MERAPALSMPVLINSLLVVPVFCLLTVIPPLSIVPDTTQSLMTSSTVRSLTNMWPGL
jgi:hypothetical protein